MRHGDFLIKNEAAWAISNVAVIGTPDQLWYLVEKGAIESLCSLLFIDDAQISVLVLDSLHRVLEALPDNYDQIAQLIEASGGLDQIETLQVRFFEYIDYYFLFIEQRKQRDLRARFPTHRRLLFRDRRGKTQRTRRIQVREKPGPFESIPVLGRLWLTVNYDVNYDCTIFDQ
jgi:hypothetical protein